MPGRMCVDVKKYVALKQKQTKQRQINYIVFLQIVDSIQKSQRSQQVSCQQGEAA